MKYHGKSQQRIALGVIGIEPDPAVARQCEVCVLSNQKPNQVFSRFPCINGFGFPILQPAACVGCQRGGDDKIRTGNFSLGEFKQDSSHFFGCDQSAPVGHKSDAPGVFIDDQAKMLPPLDYNSGNSLKVRVAGIEQISGSEGERDVRQGARQFAEESVENAWHQSSRCAANDFKGPQRVEMGDETRFVRGLSLNGCVSPNLAGLSSDTDFRISFHLPQFVSRERDSVTGEKFEARQ